MARERGSRRQSEAAESVETLEPMADVGRGRERPAKTPTGPSFALPLAAVAGLGAAVLAFIGALLVGGSGGDSYAALDQGGIQAARMLGALDIDRWRTGFGATKAVRSRYDKVRADKLASITDSRDKLTVEAAFDEWRTGVNRAGAAWRPGLDLLFPPQDPNDDLLETARRDAIRRATETAPDAFLGAGVFDSAEANVAGHGEMLNPPSAKPVKTVGQTNVYAVRAPGGAIARLYVHPMRSRSGAPEGTARVLLSAAGAAPASSMAGAGAAAGAAFVGAFALALLLGLGPVKAMRRLAADTEALARGELATRVAVSGPDVVQAAAKNVQRLASIAASGAHAAAAEPQIVQQQVLVQPVQEVQEGLAPLRGFRRPEEFEIEATQKVCPDLGNDYYDTVNIDDDHVGILVADIPNQRGVRGAMYMAQVRALFRAVAQREQSPAEALKLLNRVFAQDLPRGVYVTAMYCVVNRQTGVCRVANAQHLPLVFWKMSKKASARVQTEGIALGLDPGPVFDKTIVEKSIQLERGDRIVLYTDGAITARNPSGAEYGDERFYYVLNREAPKNSAACVNLLANDMDLFHEGAPQTDDFTVVTLRRVK